MPITAKLNYLRVAPRKVRLAADLIRGKTVEEAQVILNFTNKKTALPLLKLLKQAIANAKNNFQEEQSNLYISKITADEGPKLKRWRARARGRAFEIQKKTSHITLILNTIKEKKLKKIKKLTKIHPVKSRKAGISPKAKLFNRVKKTEQKPKIEKGVKRIFRRKAF